VHFRVDRPFGLLLAAALVVTVLESWRPASARAAATGGTSAAAPAAPAGPAEPLTRPDPAAARLTARATGKKVEVLSQRTDLTQVFANPDGTMTMTSAARPVRVRRPDGSWDPIDTTLTAAADGTIRPGATSVDLVFSGGGTGPLTTVTYHGVTLAVQAPASLGPLPKPTLAGDTATYPGVLPGVDLAVTADGQGYSEVLVVKTAAAAANPALGALTFPTTVTGGDVKNDTHGNLQVFGKTDTKTPVFLGPAPRMWDSRGVTTADRAARARLGGPEQPAGTARDATLPAAVTSAGITVTPGHALLGDKTAVFPVFIDPGVTVNRFLWDLLDFSQPNTALYNYAGYGRAGTYDPGPTITHIYRSLFGMATKPLTGTHILSATFDLNLTGTGVPVACTAKPISLYNTTAIYPTTDWANYPVSSSNPPNWTAAQLISTITVAKGAAGCPAGIVSFPATAAVQAAATAGWSGMSVGVRNPNETAKAAYMTFGNSPVLSVTYNTKPATPVG
jgi:hypothetical protein